MNNDASLRGFLSQRCATALPRRYLEIGTREGDSLRVVVEHAYTLERVVCADTWGGEWGGTGRGGHAHVEAMLSAMLYVGEVRFLDGDSHQTILTLDEQFDLILVDGDHSEEGGAADLRNVWPLCAPGGCIVFHDVCHPAHRYLSGVWDRFVATHVDEIRVEGQILEGHGLGYCIRR